MKSTFNIYLICPMVVFLTKPRLFITLYYIHVNIINIICAKNRNVTAVILSISADIMNRFVQFSSKTCGQYVVCSLFLKLSYFIMAERQNKKKTKYNRK